MLNFMSMVYFIVDSLFIFAPIVSELLSCDNGSISWSCSLTFYGDLVYKFKRIVEKPSFPDKYKNITKH